MIWAERGGSFSSAALAPVTNSGLRSRPRAARAHLSARSPGRPGAPAGAGAQEIRGDAGAQQWVGTGSPMERELGTEGFFPPRKYLRSLATGVKTHEERNISCSLVNI